MVVPHPRGRRTEDQLAGDHRRTHRTAVATSAPNRRGHGDDAGASGGGLAFVIVPEQSEATYLAGETLASVGLPSTAEGVTQEIAGTLYLTAGRLRARPGAGDEDHRPARQPEDRPRTAATTACARPSKSTSSRKPPSSPRASPALTRPSAPDQERTFQLTGIMTLHGVEKEVTWDVKARRDGDIMTALATINILYTDFDITQPNIGGFVSVEDDVTLQMDIVATRSS